MSSLRRIFLKIIKLFDMLLMALSFGVATIAAQQQLRTVSFEQFLAMRISVQNFVIFLGLLLVWYSIFVLSGLYRSRRLTSRRGKIIVVIKATFSGTLALFAIAVLFRIEMITPVFLATFLTVSSAVLILSRVIIEYVLKLFRTHGRNLRHKRINHHH